MQTQTNLWTDANLVAYSESNEFLCQYDLDEEQRIAMLI